MAKSHGEEIAIGFMIGVFFAILFGLLYANNIFIDKIIPLTMSITEIQFILIIFWLLIGIIIWAFRA
jgi:hypothetical protein